MRRLQSESDGESEPIVWLGSQTPSKVSEHEAAGPPRVEADARKLPRTQAQEPPRYTLRPVAERRAREAERRQFDPVGRAGASRV